MKRLIALLAVAAIATPAAGLDQTTLFRFDRNDTNQNNKTAILTAINNIIDNPNSDSFSEEEIKFAKEKIDFVDTQESIEEHIGIQIFSQNPDYLKQQLTMVKNLMTALGQKNTWLKLFLIHTRNKLSQQLALLSTNQ
ncbi:hypothetical protein HOD08_05290 [bacterium]|nr:hypothetical protein [bacterium]